IAIPIIIAPIINIIIEIAIMAISKPFIIYNLLEANHVIVTNIINIASRTNAAITYILITGSGLPKTGAG
ncbi:MAG: hypothetical protein QW250_05965, partial [Sulfolobaceae archaeon]